MTYVNTTPKVHESYYLEVTTLGRVFNPFSFSNAMSRSFKAIIKFLSDFTFFAVLLYPGMALPAMSYCKLAMFFTDLILFIGHKNSTNHSNYLITGMDT